MDGVMQALAKKRTQWKEALYFAVKFARQTLCKYYAEVSPMMGMLVISADISDPFRKLQSIWKWDMGMDINSEVETFYITQYQEAFLKYVENVYCAEHTHLPVIEPESVMCNNPFPSALASRSGQSSYDR